MPLPRGSFRCTYVGCGLMFYNCCEFSLHSRDVHSSHGSQQEPAPKCHVCNKTLDRQAQAAPRSFNCRKCSSSFRYSRQLERHNRTVHAKSRPHRCNICSKHFTKYEGLKQHKLSVHSGRRPFVCNVCNKAFTRKAGLEQHYRTHTRAKPYICTICSRCFSQLAHLKQHNQSHESNYPQFGSWRLLPGWHGNYGSGSGHGRATGSRS